MSFVPAVSGAEWGAGLGHKGAERVLFSSGATRGLLEFKGNRARWASPVQVCSPNTGQAQDTVKAGRHEECGILIQTFLSRSSPYLLDERFDLAISKSRPLFKSCCLRTFIV